MASLYRGKLKVGLLLRPAHFQTSEVYPSAARWRNSGLGKYFDRQNLYKDLGGLSPLSSNKVG